MVENTFLKKFVTCFVAGLVLSALLLVLGNSGTISWFPPVVVFSLVGLSLLLSILFPFAWQLKEMRYEINSNKIHEILVAFIRYCIAFNLASFGWKKLLGLQFVVPESIARLPMNQQSGEWLTWYYFGHSFTFGLIIASIQIGGSMLLLFRRTVLLGSVILFSLMLNLLLINIFYQMNGGALLQSVVLTIGLSFLIFLQYKRLIQFFLATSENSITLGNGKMKNLLRLSVLFLSLLFTIYLKASMN